MAKTKADKKNNASGPKKERPRYVLQSDMPSYSLMEALKVPKALEQYALDPTPPLQIAKAMNLRPHSRPFRMMCGASVAYGLTSGGAKAAQIAITDLGKRILRPPEDGDDLTAKREALLKPRVFREFLEKYDRSPLPRNAIAHNVLTRMGIPEDRVVAALEMILESAEQVGFVEKNEDTRSIDLSGTAVPKKSSRPRNARIKKPPEMNTESIKPTIAQRLLKVIGGLLAILGIFSGVVLMLASLGLEIAGSVVTFWGLFLIYFIGGLVLYFLGAQDASIEKVLKVSGGIILILGVVSASIIFSSKVKLLEVEFYSSLWALFLVCTIAGAAGILMSEKYESYTATELLARAAARNLERRFDKHMLSRYQHNRPVLKLIQRFGGPATVRRYLHSQGFSPGYKKLVTDGRLDETLEALIRLPEWQPLFTDLERWIALRRLQGSGYEPGSGDSLASSAESVGGFWLGRLLLDPPTAGASESSGIKIHSFPGRR